MSLTARHQVVAFYGVPTTGTGNTVTTTYRRMKNFTQLSKAKNPQEYNRKYVDDLTRNTICVLSENRTTCLAILLLLTSSYVNHKSEACCKDCIEAPYCRTPVEKRIG